MESQPIFGPVRHELVGDNGPSVRPSDDPALFGTADLSLAGRAVEARSFQTYTLTYRVGRLGLDDTGSIRVATRIVSDAGKPQITDPAAPNYLTARCSGQGRIALRVGPDGQRPWNLTVTAELRGGYLKEGEEIVLTFGDTSQGSPGMAMQTFAEGGYELRVGADVQATGNYQPLDGDFCFPVVAGPAVRWVAVLPTLRRPGETFHLGLKAEDFWGNPTAMANGRVELRPSLPGRGAARAVRVCACRPCRDDRRAECGRGGRAAHRRAGRWGEGRRGGAPGCARWLLPPAGGVTCTARPERPWA